MKAILTAASFEDRCRALPKDIDSIESEPCVVFLVDFMGYEDVGPYLSNRHRMIQDFRKKGYTVEIVEVDITSPLAALSQFERIVGNAGPREVLVDISSFPRNYLFTLSRFFAVTGIPCMIRYYRPKFYGKELSRGIRALQAIPGFEGDLPAAGDVVLAVVLGFEGYKALHAWETIGPQQTLGFLGDPPYETRFLVASREYNQRFFQETDAKHGTLHTLDALVARDQLQAAYDQLRKESGQTSLVLCPLGTKLQSLACFAFAMHNPEVAVVYVASMVYFTQDYSRGWHAEYTEIALSDLLSVTNQDGGE